MLYYYLDGLDKKGPYTPEELKFRNISLDTLVFQEGMVNWVAIKDLPDLKKFIFSETVGEINEKTKENPSDNLTNSDQKNAIRIPASIFLILGILLAVGISYIVVTSQREQDLDKIDRLIDDVFHRKEEVCDYQKTGVQGQLRAAGFFDSKDNDGNKLVEIYDCSAGGFNIITLSKKANGYDMVESKSGNLGYKIPDSKWTPPKEYGYGLTTPGYSSPTYRQSIQTGYDEAMKYLSSEKENKSYEPGEYDKIKSFDQISTGFYYIDNIIPTKYIPGSNFSKSWFSNGNAYVYNREWIVWYTFTGKHFEIVENKTVFYRK